MYARPFTRNEVGRLPGSFEQFDSKEQASLHRMLRDARNNTFAHIGVHPALSVWVMPPGSFHERGSSTVGTIPYSRDLLPGIVELCDLQADRCSCWIDELLDSLYGYRAWPPGSMCLLDWPSKSFGPQMARGFQYEEPDETA